MNLFLSILLFSFANLSSKSATKKIDKSVEKNNKTSTFGDVSKETEFLKISDNINFIKFLKEFNKGCVLKKVSENCVGFSTKNSVHIFNVISNKTTVIKFKEMNRTDKIDCFCSDKKYIYVKFRKYLRVFDHNGNEIISYNFKNKEYNGMDLYVDKNYFYLISHNKEIFCFRLDAQMKTVSLMFYNNDFYSSRLGKFHFLIGRDLYVLSGKRLSIVHKLSGKVLKNNYLDSSFENLILLGKNAFLYAKDKFALMDLSGSDYALIFNNKIDLFNSPLSIQADGVKFGNKFYEGIYIHTHFFNGVFFRYSQNTYDSRCFLIKQGEVSEFILEQFAISHVFYSENQLILVDIKSKKIKLI